MEYWLRYEEQYVRDYEGCPPGCNNCGGWCEQPSGHVNVYPRSLHRSSRSGLDYERVSATSVTYDFEEVQSGDTAYLVIVEYTDGGTFGYDGYWTVAGVYATQEGAERAVQRAEGDNDTEVRYRAWDGYFASLRDARVEPLMVLA